MLKVHGLRHEVRMMGWIVLAAGLSAQASFAGAISLDSGTLAQPVQIGVDASGTQYGQDLDITPFVGLGDYYGSGYGITEVEIKGTPSSGDSQVEAAFLTSGSPSGDGDVRFETKQIVPANDFSRMFPTKRGYPLDYTEQDLRERFYLGFDFLNGFDAVQTVMVRSPHGGVLIKEIKVTLSDEQQPR